MASSMRILSQFDQEIKISPDSRKRKLDQRTPGSSLEYRELALHDLMENEDSERFEQKVDKFFKKATPKPISSFDDVKLLLEDNFIVGENHDCISSKKFLIKNMQHLKEAGFDTLFMEHLYYDHQDLYDQFASAPLDQPLDPQIQQHLRELDKGWEIYLDDDKLKTWDENNFTQVVIAAKKAGIRIVALDTKFEYEQQKHHCDHFADAKDNYRAKTMNYTASFIIEMEMKGLKSKWCSLVGNSHVRTYQNILGLSELTGAKPVYIFDHASTKSPKIRPNKPSIGNHELLEGLVIRRYYALEPPQLMFAKKKAKAAPQGDSPFVRVMKSIFSCSQ